ncbi:AAA family ATPase (plasmid) [Clostridium perfringens]
MSKLYVLVGLPASGKSTWAKNNINNKTKWVSSDNLRKELLKDENNQEHNKMIFEEMRKRTGEYLNQGFNVIYDATNVSSKRRRNLIQNFKKYKKICIYFAANKEDCYMNDLKRNRQVGSKIIDKMFKEMQIPMLYEGWNVIKIIRQSIRSGLNLIELKSDIEYTDYVGSLISNKDFHKSIGLAQDNPYHTLSVTRHMFEAFKYLKNKTNDTNLLIAALLHDIGKGDCKNFKEGSKYANFISHENVSAQLSFNYLYDLAYSISDILDICMLIQLHMRFINIKDNYKAKERLLDMIGIQNFSRLLELHNADNQAK